MRRRAKERRRGGEGREERDRNRDEGRGKQKKVEEKERAKFKTNTVQSKLQQVCINGVHSYMYMYIVHVSIKQPCTISECIVVCTCDDSQLASNSSVQGCTYTLLLFFYTTQLIIHAWACA